MEPGILPPILGRDATGRFFSMNLPAWLITVVIAVAGFVGGVLWSLHANDAAQTQRLDELERRADVARGVLDQWGEQIEELRRKVALLEHRVEARP